MTDFVIDTRTHVLLCFSTFTFVIYLSRLTSRVLMKLSYLPCCKLRETIEFELTLTYYLLIKTGV